MPSCLKKPLLFPPLVLFSVRKGVMHPGSETINEIRFTKYEIRNIIASLLFNNGTFFKEKKMSDAQIFQIISLVYIAIGIGIFINPGFYKRLFADFGQNAAALYLGGITALVIGYLIVTFHNTWTKDLSVIITVIGWIALIKGIVILVLPKIIGAMSKAMAKSKALLRIEAIAIIILGLAFAFLGFCPKSPI